MKFGFRTKKKSAYKIVGEEVTDQPQLPSQASLNSQSPQASSSDTTSSPNSLTSAAASSSRASFSYRNFFASAGVSVPLVLGQLFMIAGAAVTCGTICSSLFGFSFDRIMYHCGPQDTYLGIFILAAVPVFWYAWFVQHKFLKWLLITPAVIAGGIFGSSFATGFWSPALGLLTALLLFVFHLSGSYFSTFKRNWPKSFSVSKWLAICYVPAAILLGWELSFLDLSQAVTQVSTESVATSFATIAFFCFMPALLTAMDSKSKKFASGFGLSAIGQSPALMTMLVYCLANSIMLAWASFAGTQSIADAYQWQSQLGMEPDFDSKTTIVDLTAKLLSSLTVFAVLFGSVWSGSFLGVTWNRWRNRD